MSRCEYVLLHSPIEVAHFVAELLPSLQERVYDRLLVTLGGHLHVATLTMVLLSVLHISNKVFRLLEEGQDVLVAPAFQAQVRPLLVVPGELEHQSRSDLV